MTDSILRHPFDHFDVTIWTCITFVTVFHDILQVIADKQIDCWTVFIQMRVLEQPNAKRGDQNLN